MRLQPLSSAYEVGLSVGEVVQPSYDSQSYARFNQVGVGEVLRRISTGFEVITRDHMLS
jgi:hypothetical protein